MKPMSPKKVKTLCEKLRAASPSNSVLLGDLYKWEQEVDKANLTVQRKSALHHAANRLKHFYSVQSAGTHLMFQNMEPVTFEIRVSTLRYAKSTEFEIYEFHRPSVKNLIVGGEWDHLGRIVVTKKAIDAYFDSIMCIPVQAIQFL